MAVFDASFLLLMLNPDTPAPIDGRTGQPVNHCKARIEHLIEQLSKDDTKIIVPTPALSEALIRAADAAPRYLDIMRNSRFFQVSPFNTMAAVEAADLLRKRISKFGNIKGESQDTRAKVKFDHQIAAIARVSRARTLYTDDENLQKLARSLSMRAVGIAAVPLPPEDPQQSLRFPPSADDGD